MKKSMSMIVTGLATGALLTSSMVNIPTIQAANIENSTKKSAKSDVDENGISESLKAALVSKEYFNSEDEVTPEALSTLNPSGMGLSLTLSGITDISGLQYATSLKRLDLGFNKITDLSPLQGLNLEWLSINNNPDISDLSPIENMTSLTYLHFQNDNISDISPLKSLVNLTDLQIQNNHVTDFSVLNNFTEGFKYLTITPQAVTEDSKQLNQDSFDIDLNDYLSSGGSISKATASLKNTDADVALDESTNIVLVSNIKASDTLTINFDETININGKDQVISITINQPYTVGKGSIATKPVTMNVGDKWDDSLGFESATDPFNGELTLNDFNVDTGDLDTNTEGTYTVTYISKDYPDITGTSKVTVEKGSDNSGGNNSGNNNGSNTSNVTEIDEMLLSSKKTDSISIYDVNGNKISDKTLDGVTDFSTTKKSVVNGVTYYQIGDDEWVKSSDVAEYFEYSGIVQTNSDSIKKLSNLNGETSNRGLEKTTDWQADRYTYINGEKSYRVSSNEWVKADDTLEITPVKGVLRINSETKLYHDNGQKSDRGLAKNSDFVTDKKATINGETMYRVSTNEWVPESAVTLN